MEYTHRPFVMAQDYAPLRHLLNAAWAQDPVPWLWPTVRLDSFRYGRYWEAELAGQRPWHDRFHVWERHRQGRTQLVAVAHPDGDNQICMQLCADMRTAEPTRRMLEGAILDWFAAHGRSAGADVAGAAPLGTMVYTHDALRQRLLREKGWCNQGPAEVSRWLQLGQAPPAFPLPDGFSLRTLRLDDPADLQRMADVTNRVFAHARFVPETWHALANAPTWNEDWMALAPTGECAAFCAIWVEPGLRAAWFEPVGAHPAYRRLGLARALMTACLRRLAAMGVQRVYVDTGYDMEANRLYAALGFAQAVVAERWVVGGGK